MKQPWSLRTLGIAALALVVVVAAAIAILVVQDDRASDRPVTRVVKVTPGETHRRTTRSEGTRQKSAVPSAPTVPAVPSEFAKEERMSSAQRMKRWDDFVTEASKRFTVPKAWIRAVIMAESAGRTMLEENKPIVSSAGAMGLMQLMPSTYEDMRKQHGLGADPFDPHDNILAGTAYLHFLHGKYGYPAMFAAYNDGPGHLDDRIANAGLLPTETVVYVERITGRLEGRGALVKFTRPNGSPVLLDGASVRSVRAALPNEYAPGVRSVITVGAVEQGVRENLAAAKAIILARGGAIRTKTRLVLSSCVRDEPSEHAGRITCGPRH